MAQKLEAVTGIQLSQTILHYQRLAPVAISFEKLHSISPNCHEKLCERELKNMAVIKTPQGDLARFQINFSPGLLGHQLGDYLFKYH